MFICNFLKNKNVDSEICIFQKIFYEEYVEFVKSFFKDETLVYQYIRSFSPNLIRIVICI